MTNQAPDMNDPKIAALIERVEKLLRLADNNDNENEAALASQKAMDLLEAYNLSMGDIKDMKSDSHARKDDLLDGGLYEWQRDLWQKCATLHFCMYTHMKGNKRGDKYRHRVIGSKANATLAVRMATYLQQTIDRMAKDYAKSRDVNVFCRDALAYREGMADRLVTRLEEVRRERLRQEEARKREREAQQRHPAYAGGNALVLSDVIAREDDLNNDHIQGWPLGTTAENRANALARQAAARAAFEQQMAEREIAEAKDPSLREARLAQEARVKAEYDERLAKWRKREAANERRREARGSRTQYRAETAREKRMNTRGYTKGYEDAKSVGLDDQIEKQDRKGIE